MRTNASHSTMKRLRLTLFTAAALSLMATASLHAQMLLNGSFENPAQTGSITSGNGDNWTTTGDTFVITNGANLGTTPFGTQYSFLNPAATSAQIVSSPFTLGATYTLSLSAAALGDVATRLIIAVSGGATASQAFILPARTSGPTNTPIPFLTYSLAFTPTSTAAVTFTLQNTGNSGLAMDNVQLAVATVPEPSTWALVAAGAGLLGVVLRQRRRSLRA